MSAPHKSESPAEHQSQDDLATALWHTAKGDVGQVLSRIRRAQTNLKTAAKVDAA